MAQIFPLNVDDLLLDEERASLAGTLAALPDPWTLLRQRQIGDDEAEPVEVVLVHPEIGVALVDEAPRDPAASARRLREHLDQQRFGEFFPGDLPIVTLSVAPDEFETIGERLAAAFETVPRLSVADADWADAVIELLMVPDDLAMAPVSDAAPSPMPEPEFPPARSERLEELRNDRFEAVHRERLEGVRRFDEPPRDVYRHSAPLDADEPPLPLMVDWPFAASYARKRQRGRVAALVIILLLLAGAGFAAWEYTGEDMTVAVNPLRPQIEMPLPPQSPSDRADGKPASASPPPVPAAPPVVMAQKPYAPPPPAPPAPTPVEPLPQVAATTPPSPPPAPARTAATPQPPAQVAGAPPAPRGEPPPTQTAAAPPAAPVKPAAAPSPAKPKPMQTTKAEPPLRPAAAARREPSPRSRTRRIENPDRPPIDAADLPPLDEAPHAPQRPTQFAAPGGSSEPPASGLGPPVPLWRAQASNAAPPPAAAADANTRECRPYTSSTTLTGRGLRVEGIACRGSDGQWRLVSEVPLR